MRVAHFLHGERVQRRRMRSCGGLRATRSTDISGEGSRATSASRLPRNLLRDELAKHPVLMAVSNAADYSAARSSSAKGTHHAATSTIIRGGGGGGGESCRTRSPCKFGAEWKSIMYTARMFS